MKNTTSENIFVFGTQYYRAPTPLSVDWKSDLRRIKESGLNTIKIWCIWGWMEPEPGEYRFDETDRLFDLAEEIGLKVVPNTILEVQPFWITRLYPDCNMVNHKGEKIISGLRNECFVGLSPGQCLDYDEINVQAERFLTVLASRYKSSNNLLVWDAWNEIKWAVDGEGLFCYCPATIKKFRNWLGEKYGNLDNLNKAWMRIYSDWEDVFPPKYPRTGYVDMLDWRRFITHKVTKMAEFRVNALKKGDPEHPVMIHTGGSSIGYPSQIPIYGVDDWKLSVTADLYGTSFYPNAFMPEPTLSKCALCLDATRSASKNRRFWISELQGGPASNGFVKEDITPEEQRMHIFSALSKGAKGILFWQWRNERLGIEANGFGLTHSDGSVSKRTQMAKDIANVLNKYSSVLNEASILPSEVAILFDPDTYILNWTIEGAVPDSQGFGSELVDLVDRSIHGYYKAFWDNNIQCDLIHIDDLSEVKNYKILVLPFLFFVERQTAKIIEKYVRDGGTVISDCYLGEFGEHCLSSVVTPGNGLDKVFQAREMNVVQTEEIKIEPIRKDGLFRGFEEKDSLAGYLFENSLHPFSEGKVIANFKDKNPAIVEARYGKGKSLLFGSLMGAAYLKGLSPGFKKIIKNLSEQAKICSLVEIGSDHFVETRILKGKDYYLLFCLNYEEEIEITLKIHLPGKKYRIRELSGGTPIPCKLMNDCLLIKTNVPNNAAKVFLISQRAKA